MNAFFNLPPVAAAMARHRTLVEMDEALFSDAGEPIVPEAEIKASEAEMATAWMALMRVPCLSLADVRAKVDYILNGTIGERDLILFDLTGPNWSETYAADNCLPAFLRSLMGEAHEAS